MLNIQRVWLSWYFMTSVFYLINFFVIVVTWQVNSVLLRARSFHFAAEWPGPLLRSLLQLTFMVVLFSEKLAPGYYVLVEIVTGWHRSRHALPHDWVGLVLFELNGVLHVFNPWERVCDPKGVLSIDSKERIPTYGMTTWLLFARTLRLRSLFPVSTGWLRL